MQKCYFFGILVLCTSMSRTGATTGSYYITATPLPTNATDMNAHHHEDTEGPPVGTLDVTLSVDHLGGHVLHRAAEGVRLLVVDSLFAQAEVWNTQTNTLIDGRIFCKRTP